MIKTISAHNSIRAVILAAAIAALALLGMTACQQSTEVQSTLSSKLESGTTITDGTLTVGINASDSPYGGTNSSNETIGLDVDVAASLADELGMQLQIVDVNANGRSALEDGQVDLVLSASKSGDDRSFAFSDAYIDDGISLFCLEDNAPQSVASFKLGKGEKVLAQKGTASAYAVQEALGSKSVETVSTLQEGFDALESGEQKYLVTNAVIGDYFARNYSDVQRVGFVSSTSVTPVYGMTLTSNAELTSAVDQAFETISQNGVLRIVTAKWLGSDGETLLPANVDLSKLPQTAFGSN